LNRFLLLFLCLYGLVFATGFRSHDHSRFAQMRNVIDRTQSDLRMALDFAHGDKQRARYQHAQDHLSKLDGKLVKGKFDKGCFHDAVEAIKKILDHNTLQASGRDALMQDLNDLTVVRETR
jgi:hypothetical protein